MAPKVVMLIDLSDGKNSLLIPLVRDVSPHQLKIIEIIYERPYNVSQLEKILGRHKMAIYNSIKSLMLKGMVKQAIYISKHNIGKASLRKYYFLADNIITRHGPSRRYTHRELEKIFKHDDEEIIRQIRIANATLMISSPNPVKQAMGRRILQELRDYQHQGP